jgi:SAM-dependent methyltransferase
MNLSTTFRELKTRMRKKYFGLAGLGSLDKEVGPYLKDLKGLVFNAGAGHRPVKIEQPCLTTDFDETAPVDFLCDLHYIPLMDQCMDSILTVAVLEHTRYPWLVVQEFARILKPGGVLVFGVPFLQPEHAVPHDFYRYTIYGVQALLTSAGFNINRQIRLSRYYRALGWLLQEKWKNHTGLASYLELFVVNQISRRSRDDEQAPLSVYTGSYTIAEKPGQWDQHFLRNLNEPVWFRDLLVDPLTKAPLRWVSEDRCENAMGDEFFKNNGKFDFRPKGEQSQDFAVKWGS